MVIADIVSSFTSWGQSIISTMGYPGLFIVSVIGNASIILPLPTILFVIAFAKIANNFLLVGIVAGAGAAIGELTGYYAGRGGRLLVEKSHKDLFSKTKKWTEKYGMFLVIIFFAATPLPADVIGIIAGIIKYDVKKFLLANFIGKTIKFATLAFASANAIDLILNIFTGK